VVVHPVCGGKVKGLNLATKPIYDGIASELLLNFNLQKKNEDLKKSDLYHNYRMGMTGLCPLFTTNIRLHFKKHSYTTE
jgi:hypothetical protein